MFQCGTGNVTIEIYNERFFFNLRKLFLLRIATKKRRFVQFQRIFSFTKCDGKGVLFNSKEFLLLGNATEKAFSFFIVNFPFPHWSKTIFFVQFCEQNLLEHSHYLLENSMFDYV